MAIRRLRAAVLPLSELRRPLQQSVDYRILHPAVIHGSGPVESIAG